VPDTPTEFALALTTVGSEEEGLALARALVEQGLAACVNVIPGVTSVYRWKGAVQTDPERLLVIKTRVALFPRLQEAVHRLHAYELPELILVPLTGGDARYLAWLAEGTGDRHH
jgi:periplasmic divalent cation tolerance protein